MACALVALDSTSGCPDNEGGLQHSYACKLSDITAITVTSGVISAITMSTTGLIKKLVYDKNETSYFNQVGERTNDTGALKYSAEALMSFGGMSSTYKSFADDMGDCCKLVFFHVLQNGSIVVQGIEIDTGATGNLTGTKVRDTKITPTQNSGTSAEEAALQIIVRGRSKKMAPFTSLTQAAIEAL